MKSERDIRAVLELARYSNFGRAAEVLGMTQPALTRQLQRIEDALGVALFDRTARGVEPTLFGRIAIERGERILKGFDDFRHNVEIAASKELGELKIVTTMYPAAISVWRAVAELNRRHPKLKVHLTIDDQPTAAKKLRDREADVGVMWLPPKPDDDLTYQRLPRRRHAFYCRAGHPLSLFPDATPAQIADYPLVGFHMGHEMTPFEPHELKFAGAIDPVSGVFQPRMLVNSFVGAYSVVQSSNAISWAPLCLLADRIERKEIVKFSLSLERFVCGYEIAWPSERAISPASQAFADILVGLESAIA